MTDARPRQRTDIAELLRSPGLTRVSAPMVRYSKLAFRDLVRRYGVDVTFTPMMLADCFRNSSKSRFCEFVSYAGDRPLVAQFAASNPDDFTDSAVLISPYVDAVDLNCETKWLKIECQRSCFDGHQTKLKLLRFLREDSKGWAAQECLGAKLMTEPELVRSIIHQAWSRNCVPISVKIRVHPDLRDTVDFAQKMEAAGASWITVHGRTRSQKSNHPVNLDAIKLIKESVSVPVIANGDIFSLQDAERVASYTGANGIMAARGLLQNPALFAGYKQPPREAIEYYFRRAIEVGTTTSILQHHISYMVETILSRGDMLQFNALPGPASIQRFLTEKGILDPDFTSLQHFGNRLEDEA